MITDVLCTRILFDGQRAAGVEVERVNVLSELRAEREVILCAGAYNSPQILMLSGVGIADELQAYGIEPRMDLPVGKNLQDHPSIDLDVPDRHRDAHQSTDRGECSAPAQ